MVENLNLDHALPKKTHTLPERDRKKQVEITDMKKVIITISSLLALTSLGAAAQQVLTLEDCRQLAIENSDALETARQKIEISALDKKIAEANYYPKISAAGTYMYANKDLKLISDETTKELSNAGTILQKDINDKLTAILSDPTIYQQVATSPALQKFIGYVQGMDIATPINSIGSQIGQALDIDMRNTTAAVISIQQPVFMGGKIAAANRMAEYAKQLAQEQYGQEYSQVVVDIEQAYWQIVSIAGKKRLAEGYAGLLHQMEKDTDALVAEGFATPSDVLTIKVKANEADMLLTKATNGLALAKMLLCKECGLPLDSQITLADENLDKIPVPEMSPVLSDEQVWEARPEIKSLALAEKIYDKKVEMVRADMLPTVALTANYMVTNPNIFNGYQKKYGDFFTAGVMVSVPLFHGGEGRYKTRKAQAEAALTRIQMDDAKKMITLQVSQLRQQTDETLEKLTTAESNLAAAEENLRVATAGWNEGMIASNVVLQAQTAWLQANSEVIEAGVELQMCSVNLAKAEGRL